MTTWVEISKDNLIHNVRQLRSILPAGFKIMAVVKSNAYGHSSELTAKVLDDWVDYFCVVSVEEAILLKKSNIKKPILVLSILGFDDKLLSQAIKEGIELPIFDEPSYRKIARTAQKIKIRPKVHLKIDTGMSRMGLPETKAKAMALKIAKNKNLIFQGIFSHLALADGNSKITGLQIQKFREILKFLNIHKIKVPVQHILNTPGMMTTVQAVGNGARLGLGIYGLYPSRFCKETALRKNSSFNLKSVLSWQTRIIQTKDIAKGQGISYGYTFITKNKIKIAVLPVGYWDGLGRRLSNIGYVLIKGKKCRIIGRICMNHTIVDVSKLKNAKVGDRATLLGRNDRKEITADQLTKMLGTINYGVLTRISPLIPRILIN
ncbi:MAG: alanine racemase [Patescibacteria group bacterium]|nr:alanine racemase [Patescibacteria group bacterium]